MTNKFLYSAYVLTPESKNTLKQVLNDLKVQMLENEFLHHCTIEFGDDTIVTDKQVGQYVSIEVIGLCFDNKAQAFLVDTCLSKNKNPHITISTSNEVKPFYSNQMIENNTPLLFNYPIEIVTRIEKFYSNSL